MRIDKCMKKFEYFATWNLFALCGVLLISGCSQAERDLQEVISESVRPVLANSADDILNDVIVGEYTNEHFMYVPSEESAEWQDVEELARTSAKKPCDPKKLYMGTLKVIATIPEEVRTLAAPFFADVVNQPEYTSALKPFVKVDLLNLPYREPDRKKRTYLSVILESPDYEVTVHWFLRAINDALRAAERQQPSRSARVFLVSELEGRAVLSKSYRVVAFDGRDLGRRIGDDAANIETTGGAFPVRAISAQNRPMYRRMLDAEASMAWLTQQEKAFHYVSSKPNPLFVTKIFRTCEAASPHFAAVNPSWVRAWVHALTDQYSGAFCRSTLREKNRLSIRYEHNNGKLSVALHMHRRPSATKLYPALASTWSSLLREAKNVTPDRVVVTQDDTFFTESALFDLILAIAQSQFPPNIDAKDFLDFGYRTGKYSNPALFVKWKKKPPTELSLRPLTEQEVQSLLRQDPNLFHNHVAVGCDIDDQTVFSSASGQLLTVCSPEATKAAIQ